MEREDELLRNLFSQGKSDPSQDITENVMKAIQESSKVYEYHPVIGKRVWILLALCFGVSMMYLLAQTKGIAIKIPGMINSIGLFFGKLTGSFKLSLDFQLPQIHSTYLLALSAIIIIGVYLMISLKVNRRIFK